MRVSETVCRLKAIVTPADPAPPFPGRTPPVRATASCRTRCRGCSRSGRRCRCRRLGRCCGTRWRRKPRRRRRKNEARRGAEAHHSLAPVLWEAGERGRVARPTHLANSGVLPSHGRGRKSTECPARSWRSWHLLVFLSGCARHAKQASLTPQQWDRPANRPPHARRAGQGREDRPVRGVDHDHAPRHRRHGPPRRGARPSAARQRRLRPWKLGQAIFDLTINPQGTWRCCRRTRRTRCSRPVRTRRSSCGSGRRTSAISSRRRGSPSTTRRAQTFTVSRKMGDGMLTCEVERSTLTPHVYRFEDEQGKTRFTLLLDDYKEIDGQPFPTRNGGQGRRRRAGAGGTDQRGDQRERSPPKAFVAPRKAEKLP